MRLLSYNIHKGIGGGDRLYWLERVVQVIEAENPDLICLQEVDRNVPRSRHHDQPRVLADYFHAAAHVYQMNVHLHQGGYGNLVLSRWPLLSRHHISLRLRTKKPRGAQLVVVATPEGPLHLVNWHLGLGAKERQWQVAHLLDHHLFQEAAHLPTVIAGDFNDWRNLLAGDGFHKHSFRQVTAPPSRFRSFPAWYAVAGLDKVFLRGDIVVKNAHVVHSALARRASDHLPVVVDFHMPNGIDDLDTMR